MSECEHRDRRLGKCVSERWEFCSHEDTNPGTRIRTRIIKICGLYLERQIPNPGTHSREFFHVRCGPSIFGSAVAHAQCRQAMSMLFEQRAFHPVKRIARGVLRNDFLQPLHTVRKRPKYLPIRPPPQHTRIMESKY